MFSVFEYGKTASLRFLKKNAHTKNFEIGAEKISL
jgi:hypothetical protein